MKQHPSITAVSWSAGALKLGSEGCLHREGLELWGRKEGREQSKAKQSLETVRKQLFLVPQKAVHRS